METTFPPETPPDVKQGVLTQAAVRLWQLLQAAWNGLWFAAYDPLPAGLFRIGLGLLTLTMCLCSAPNWERFYAADGIISLDVPQVQALADPPERFSVFRWGEGVVPLRAWWWVKLGVGLCLTIGWQTRLATVALWILVCSEINRNRWIVNGDDLVVRMLLFHSMLAPLGSTLSLDAWLRKRRGLPAPTHQVWPVRMLQFGTLMVYVASTPNKLLDDPAWREGMAIYWTMTSDMWSRLWFPWVSYRYGFFFTKCATYGSLLIEGGFPIAVWIPRLRPWALGALVSLHLGIALFIPHVTFFTLSMVVALSLFLPAQSLRRFLARLRVPENLLGEAPASESEATSPLPHSDRHAAPLCCSEERDRAAE